MLGHTPSPISSSWQLTPCSKFALKYFSTFIYRKLKVTSLRRSCFRQICPKFFRDILEKDFSLQLDLCFKKKKQAAATSSSSSSSATSKPPPTREKRQKFTTFSVKFYNLAEKLVSLNHERKLFNKTMKMFLRSAMKRLFQRRFEWLWCNMILFLMTLSSYFLTDYKSHRGWELLVDKVWKEMKRE